MILIRKSTENSPSLAPNGPSLVLASQELPAQLHSGHLRAHSSHILLYATQEEQTFPSHSGRSTVNVDFPASDIVIRITSPSTKSNSLNGDVRIVFENAADMVQYHTWFVNPFVNPAENDTCFERYWAQAATKLGWSNMDMRRPSMTFLSLLGDEIRPI